MSPSIINVFSPWQPDKRLQPSTYRRYPRGRPLQSDWNPVPDL